LVLPFASVELEAQCCLCDWLLLCVGPFGLCFGVFACFDVRGDYEVSVRNLPTRSHWRQRPLVVLVFSFLPGPVRFNV
jgi:hypothetical protein